MMADVLALIGFITVCFLGLWAFRFFKFRSEVINNLILQGFTRAQAKNIYEAKFDQINAMYFQMDMTPQALSEVMAENYSHLIEKSMSLQDSRTCPYCAEQVSAAAIKCKHCSSNIEPIIRTCSYCDTDVRSPIMPCDEYSPEDLKNVADQIKSKKCQNIISQKLKEEIVSPRH